MKIWLKDCLICPECAGQEIPLDLSIEKEEAGDVLEGALSCPECGASFEIADGAAVLLPESSRHILKESSGYNSEMMVSSYIWSHFSEFFNGTGATDAYRKWASFFTPKDGPAIDIGCAVGRLSFELSKTHTRVVGIDTSLAFVKNARKLLTRRALEGELVVEGNIVQKVSCDLAGQWDFENVEFVVADALALPFPREFFATASSINILEKVPEPMRHLAEVDRVLRKADSMFVFSDPFSWDASVSRPDKWLGGRNRGKFKGRGMDVMKRLFSGEENVFQPPLAIDGEGLVEWKIRKTENLSELITSQFLIGKRP